MIPKFEEIKQRIEAGELQRFRVEEGGGKRLVLALYFTTSVVRYYRPQDWAPLVPLIDAWVDRRVQKLREEETG